MLDDSVIVAEWYDIYGTRHIPFWQHPYGMWGMFVIVLGAACALLIFLWYRYRRSVQYVSPRDHALRGLREIRAQYLHPHHTRVFYVKLTQITKQYMSEACGLDVRSKTDAEIVTILKSDCSIDGIKSLSAIFQHVERIKFASGVVEREKMSQDADLLDCFIALHHSNNQTNQNT